MEEIRKIWITEKHELEDNLPNIYREAIGEDYPGCTLDENLIFGSEEIEILKEITGKNQTLFKLARELINIERQHQTMSRRSGLFGALEQAFKKNLFEDKDEAVESALERYNLKDAISSKIEELSAESSDCISN